MTEFRCIFLNHKIVYESSPLKYRDYFINYDPNTWSKGSGDGVFSVNSTNGESATLTVLEYNCLGISVRYNYRKSGYRKGVEYYSIGDITRISDICDVGDEQFAPIGSFLTPTQAWLAVEDFFKDPYHKSNRIEWVSSDDIKWPDDF